MPFIANADTHTERRHLVKSRPNFPSMMTHLSCTLMHSLSCIEPSSNTSDSSYMNHVVERLNFNWRTVWGGSSRAHGDQRPVVLGGESQCLSICRTALVHSATHALASCCTPAAVGARLPHMAGFVAKARACLAMSPLSSRQYIGGPRRRDNWKTILFFNLQQHKPAIIPATDTRRITDHQTLFRTTQLANLGPETG